MDVDDVDLLNFVVMVMLEVALEDHSEVVVVAQMSGFHMHPVDPLLQAHSVHPHFLHVRMFEFGPHRVVFHLHCRYFPVLVEGRIDVHNFVSHLINL